MKVKLEIVIEVAVMDVATLATAVKMAVRNADIRDVDGDAMLLEHLSIVVKDVSDK